MKRSIISMLFGVAAVFMLSMTLSFANSGNLYAYNAGAGVANISANLHRGANAGYLSGSKKSNKKKKGSSKSTLKKMGAGCL